MRPIPLSHWAREHDVGLSVNDSLFSVNGPLFCDSRNLRPDDKDLYNVAMRTYKQLFATWTGKKVVLVGDSVIGGFYWSTLCAAAAFGGRGEDQQIVERTGAGLVYSHTVLFGNSSKAISFRLERHLCYEFYRPAEKANISAEDCAIDVLFRSLVEADIVIMNFGHLAFPRPHIDKPRYPVVDFTNEMVADLLTLKARTVVVDHSPLHFPGPTGDYLGDESNAEKRCVPHDSASLSAQTVYTTERDIERVINASLDITRGRITFSSWFWIMAAKWEYHLPWEGDCLHFIRSPTVQAPLAGVLLQALRTPENAMLQ